MKTYQPKAKDIKHKWHLVDAQGKVLGRVATHITQLLMGKNKKSYAPHMDMGDYVVVVNAAMVAVTGKKAKNKVYYRHSGYPGGLKEIKFSKLILEQPEKIIERAVYGMLPANRLRDKRVRRLKVFVGNTHPYTDKFKS